MVKRTLVLIALFVAGVMILSEVSYAQVGLAVMGARRAKKRMQEKKENQAQSMAETKKQTDDIATSQKLISQSMEEMSQTAETMTNASKGALESDGRIKRSVSSVR